MNKLIKTQDYGHKYMAPSCEVLELNFEYSVMIQTSGVKEEEEEDW